MTIQRRFALISGRFEPELVAGFAGIYTQGMVPGSYEHLSLSESKNMPACCVLQKLVLRADRRVGISQSRRRSQWIRHDDLAPRH